MQQALMMSQKSGFTSIGLWNILHLLAKIIKTFCTRSAAAEQFSSAVT
jgi:hypothetical protein